MFFPKNENAELYAGTDGKVLCMSKCKLYQGCLTQKMLPSGKGEKRILIVAEAPGEKEDEKGIQLVGRAGRFLSDCLRDRGYDLERDCWKTNAVCCRPPNNRKPSDLEISACRPYLYSAIRQFSPHVIMLMGGTAVTSFLGHRWDGKVDGINKWRGWCIPDQDVQAWVCPMWHPSYVLRMEDPVVDLIFEKDLSRALKCLNLDPVDKVDYKAHVEILTGHEDILHVLKNLENMGSPFAFDYETTGLRPEGSLHRVVTTSVANTELAWAWEVPVEDKEYDTAWKSFLTSHAMKVAANLKFEESWSRVKYGTRVVNWVWDTMLSAHEMDNRPKVTGLKFQVYVNFGVIDYSSTVKGLLKSDASAKDKDGANAQQTGRTCD